MRMPRQGSKSAATELRHRVIIQDKTEVADGEGGQVVTWVDRPCGTWAGVSPIRADQRAEYLTENVHATHLIRVRGKEDLVDDGTNRIKYGTRIFKVLTVEDIQERGIIKVCTTQEIRNRGRTNL